jgi:hypothetical protein
MFIDVLCVVNKKFLQELTIPTFILYGEASKNCTLIFILFSDSYLCVTPVSTVFVGVKCMKYKSSTSYPCVLLLM